MKIQSHVVPSIFLHQSNQKALVFWRPAEPCFVLATGVQTNNTFGLLHRTYYDKDPSTASGSTRKAKASHVLKRQRTFDIGGKLSLTAEASDFIAVPKFVQHSFKIDIENTELLSFNTPAGCEQIAIGTAHPALKLGVTPSGIPSVSFHQCQTLSAQYGLTKVNSNPDFGTGNEKPSWEGTGAIQCSTLRSFQAGSDTAPVYWVKPAIPEL
jgi:hypothetical protein